MHLQIAPSIRSFLLFPFLILIISGLFIPSDGSHGILNIKSLAFITSILGATTYALTSQKLNLQQFRLFLFCLFSLLFLICWFVVAMIKDEFAIESTIDQLKIFLLTISVVVLSTYYVAEKVIAFKTLLKMILLTNFTYSLIKVSLVILHLFGIIDLWAFLEATGIRFMSMNIFGNIPRMQTSIDIASPFLLFFFLQSSRFDIQWKRWFKILFTTITLIAVFLSFSRYLIAIALISITLHLLTLQLKTILSTIAILFGCCLVATYLIGPDVVYEVIERRVSSKDVDLSDGTRMWQVNALIAEFLEYPILGKGLGGYTKESIRDNAILHSYEVQWVAFLMQFGISGLLLLLIATGIIAFKILTLPISRSKIGLFVLFFFWLLSGFTNPFLISLTSGILYSVFFLSANEMNKREGICIQNPI